MCIKVDVRKDILLVKSIWWWWFINRFLCMLLIFYKFDFVNVNCIVLENKMVFVFKLYVMWRYVKYIKIVLVILFFLGDISLK